MSGFCPFLNSREVLLSFELDDPSFCAPVATGIDEVGRGCLAGPVMVAAVTWDSRAAAAQSWFSSLKDSKLLSAQKRAWLFPLILQQASYVRVASLSHVVIDCINILQATLHGFELVAPAFSSIPLLIDGNKKPSSLHWAETLIKGDSRHSAIAAASIVAKVIRDGVMVHLDRQDPLYGFSAHKGYATTVHREALQLHGPGLFHRKSFAPISAMCAQANDHDSFWLEKLAVVENPDVLRDLWLDFTQAYASLSLGGARRVVASFEKRGLKITGR